MSDRRPLWRQAVGPGFFLVLLVLAFQIILPPGVMPASGPGLPLVLCTGHGPASLAPTAPADRHHDGGVQHACPFAHHGLTASAPTSPTIGVAVAAYVVVASPLPAGLSPGAGLAAPPPPSHAPPAPLQA